MTHDPVTEAHRRLAVRTSTFVVVSAVPIAGVAGAVLGPNGALSALIGVAFVLVLFGASAAALAWTVARHPGAALGVLVGGALGRLVLYAAALNALTLVTWIHRPALALATGAAATVTLAAELHWLARSPQLFWVDAEAGQATVSHAATRS